MSSDAIVVLKADHKEIRNLFREFQAAGDKAAKKKSKIAGQIIELLTVHTYIENEVMYPEVCALLPDLKDDVLESYEEHHSLPGSGRQPLPAVYLRRCGSSRSLGVRCSGHAWLDPGQHPFRRPNHPTACRYIVPLEGAAMGLSYDRRVPEELLKALEPGGFAHSLVEFGGSGMWALDLQLRGLGEIRKKYRATLYVGTTKVLDLHLTGQSFALSAYPKFASQANGWDAAWAQRHDDRWFAARWTEVDNYLQVVVEQIMEEGTYVKEGMLQAAIGRFPSTGFTVIDREAIVSFGSRAEKDACKSQLAARWLDALHRADPPGWWKTRPAKLGDECDALAVSSGGEVLAIEVKPHTASDKDIAWSVLQAGMYADLFQLWADHAGAKAHEVLHDMAGQRNRIGLPGRTAIKLAAPIKVRPVVALDRRASHSAKEKLAAVRAHLTAAGLAADLDVRQVNLVGRLDPLS